MPAITGTGFARFMELRGSRVVEKSGVLWHSVGYGMYISLPYYRRPELDPAEAGEITRSIRALGVRYPSVRWAGLPSGLYVCRRKDYDLRIVHRHARNYIRQGLPVCEVRAVTEQELLTQALAINLEALERQGRVDPEFGSEDRWRRFVNAVLNSRCIGAVGAFVDGELASFAITSREDGCLEILYKMTSYRHDRSHPSQVLDFTLVRQLAMDPTLSMVSMGWAPLVPKPRLHDYKIRMGLDFEPHASVIRLHPGVENILTCRLTVAGFRGAQRLLRGSQRFAMAAAVVEGACRTRDGTALTLPADKLPSGVERETEDGATASESEHPATAV